MEAARVIVYCITAKNRKALAPIVLRKKKEGFRRHGRVVGIGGAVVQGMVEGESEVEIEKLGIILFYSV